ncbi:hypothetical protein [Streptomyces luteogriseus]|uniref:hypothetical protein n=1 Tax=Streptomyces luteogriseus TaxID=68233 RepID=UPI003829FADA
MEVVWVVNLTHDTQQEVVQEIEVLRIDLSPEEKAKFRASPEEFMKELLETEGYEVNGLAIDVDLYNRRDEDGGGGADLCDEPLIDVHIKQGSLRSTHFLKCPHPI